MTRDGIIVEKHYICTTQLLYLKDNVVQYANKYRFFILQKGKKRSSYTMGDLMLMFRV